MLNEDLNNMELYRLKYLKRITLQPKEQNSAIRWSSKEKAFKRKEWVKLSEKDLEFYIVEDEILYDKPKVRLHFKGDMNYWKEFDNDNDATQFVLKVRDATSNNVTWFDPDNL
jgi:hypothetical protein